MNRPRLEDSKISIVMPLLNEVAVIEQLVDQTATVLNQTGCQWQFILVNDGSTDGSREVLDRMADSDKRIVVLHLSRNFGHQSALHAGLEHATGDATILMDSDAQDDPNVLPQMIQQWQSGYDVVYAVRFGRKENILKRTAFNLFHRTMQSLASIAIPRDAGNFGLMDARVVQHVVSLGETDRYFPGLRTWVGFKQCALPVERLRRHDDQPRVSFRGLVSLAKTAMFSFSRVPLLAFYGLALVSLMLGFSCIIWALYHKLFTGQAIPGWASVTTVSAFFGAINALGIAILGEYIARIYDQVRDRPAYVVQEAKNLTIKETNASAKTEQELLLNIQDLLAELDDVKSERNRPNVFPMVDTNSIGLSNDLTNQR
ncbi:MAG: glycosyltransferase family 2 protein [Planctomycetaceae bacterium]|nr:glycosyltransferase family 2 protein [Planctomycetaceae bacterium]MCP4480787.1 glycosyltransferase family 2 protein [Planctomycetaceae bacterium]MCP4779122.1 glycosyltransferase family 2 protein [Planctomycetaceae bacterium]